MKYTDIESAEELLLDQNIEKRPLYEDEIPVVADEVALREALSTKLNEINIINIIAFGISFIITFFFGEIGLGSLLSNQDLSSRYETIVKPDGWAQSLWYLIYVSQGVFAAVQMLPKYRATSLIQRGVNYWYFFASLFQMGWTLGFFFDIIPISLVLTIFVLVSVIGLLISMGNVKKRENSWQEYWFIKFPFELLGGWIIVALIVNINVLFVFFNASASVQLGMGIISLVSLYFVAGAMTCIPKHPTFVIPAVMAWTAAGIFSELLSPSDTIVDTFSAETLVGVQTAALASSIIIMCQIGVRLIYHFSRQRQQRKFEEQNTA